MCIMLLKNNEIPKHCNKQKMGKNILIFFCHVQRHTQKPKIQDIFFFLKISNVKGHNNTK